MIAPVKRWYAALVALPILLSGAAAGADNPAAAARELAGKTAAFAGRGEPVSAAWRNISSLGSSEFSKIRASFEAELRQAGIRISDIAPLVEAKITLSGNQSEYLLIEEARKGEERQTWIASWKRTPPAPAPPPPGRLEKTLLWEQQEQTLDAAFAGDGLLLLTPSSLVWLERRNGQWTKSRSVPLPGPGIRPRDMRGRLRVSGASYQAALPGFACSGSWQPPVTLECKDSEEPWVLESGNRALMLAQYAAGRNYFDGRIVTQSGQRKTVVPFYSGAAVEEQGKQLWLLAGVDGRTRLFDAGFEAAGEIGSWGSDIAGVRAECRAGGVVLATRPGDSGADAVQGYAVLNHAPEPFTGPVEMPGPVTALWVSGGGSAFAVARDSARGTFALYHLAVSCGP